MLADFAQVDPGGKAHILGAGWSVMGPQPGPMAVVVFVQLEWNEANKPLEWKLELLRGDGQPVQMPGPAGLQPVGARGGMEGGRPPGLAEGSPIPLAPLAVNMPPAPLEAGRYEWRFAISGKHIDEVVAQQTFSKAGPSPDS